MFFAIVLLTMVLALANAFTTLAPAKVRAPTALSSASNMPHDDDKMPFYALGINFGEQIGDLNLKSVLKEEEMKICLEAFAEHLRGTAIADARTVLTTYGPKLNDILNERRLKMIDDALKLEREFIQSYLNANKDAEQTESGLIYHETQAGNGASPTMESQVEVHYHGTLMDGTVVDSSRDRGQSMSAALKQVIPGWSEGLKKMSEGGKATLVIPSDLAYGDTGSGPIPPAATLKFEVELIKVLSPMDMMGETEVITLPDGTKMTVPKGVKMRIVNEEEESSSSAS